MTRGKKQRGKAVTAARPVDLLEASLKRNIRRHLKLLGFSKGADAELIPPAVTKDAIRILHTTQRDDLLRQHIAAIFKLLSPLPVALSAYLAFRKLPIK